MEEKKKIIVCGGGISQKDALIQHLVNSHKFTVLTIDEAKEQGIDMSDVVLVDEMGAKLTHPKITITELMPMFREQNYKDDNKRLKGHERPYRFHR